MPPSNTDAASRAPRAPPWRGAALPHVPRRETDAWPAPPSNWSLAYPAPTRGSSPRSGPPAPARPREGRPTRRYPGYHAALAAGEHGQAEPAEGARPGGSGDRGPLPPAPLLSVKPQSRLSRIGFNPRVELRDAVGKFANPPANGLPASAFAEPSIKLDSAVDVGVVIAPRIWPKAVVISGLGTSKSPIHSGDSQPNRHARLVATAPFACKKVDASQSARIQPRKCIVLGGFCLCSCQYRPRHHDGYAWGKRFPGHKKSSAFFANVLMVWQACPSVSCGRPGEGARGSI